MTHKYKKYKVPIHIGYEMLAGPPLSSSPYNKHKVVGCLEIIHCTVCVLNCTDGTNMCSISNGKVIDILDRLVEYNVISKGEVMDLMLKGK